MKRARVVGLAIGLAVGVTIGACHGHDDAAAVQVVAGAPAGDVIEVAGDVKATRDGKTRALGKGDIVSGDDVIATGADGRVTIVLRHNQVSWSLGPNKEKKVADSAAWAAAKGASGELVGDDHSTAAGRHAERSATDTEASAPPTAQAAAAPVAEAAPAPGSAPVPAQAPVAEEAAPPAAAAPAPPPPPPPPPPPSPPRASRSKAEPPPAPPPPKSVDRVLDTRGSFDSELGGAAPSGGAGAAAPSAAPHAHLTLAEVSVDGGIDPAIATSVLRARTGVFRACYERELHRDPTLAGLISIRLVVDGDGAVTASQADGPDALAPVRQCIDHQLRRLHFPALGAQSSISAKMSLSPSDG